jgi:hypothetical protein
MRILAIAAILALASISASACNSLNPPVRTLVLPSQAIAAPYDFDGISAALRTRAVILDVPTPAEAARAMPVAAFVRTVRQQLTAQPEAEIVSIHLVVADMDSEMLQLDRVLAYAVETTGHDTGNCISLYDATTAATIMGACFFSDRSHP